MLRGPEIRHEEGGSSSLALIVGCIGEAGAEASLRSPIT